MPSTPANRSLHAAKTTKQDEFYTQISDIEKELKHYQPHFKKKTVLCNCDDPRVSHFFKYFINNFEKLALKKLIATCYQNDKPDLFSQHKSDRGIYFEYSGEQKKQRLPDPAKIKPRSLEHDGDFRSDECVRLLKQADIVVTNPPFSLFREYVGQLVRHEKKFIIIGNLNAVTYNDVFQLIKENRIWLGPSIHSGDREFGVPDHYPLNAAGTRVDESGNKFIRVKGVRWFTNLDFAERHEDLVLFKEYSPANYPTYDNYDAIEVSKTNEIPMDYDGVMGVPITFLDRYNPDQFEILGLSGEADYPMTRKYSKKERVVDGVRMKSNTGTLRAVIRTDSFGAGTHFDVGYPVRGVYRRLFIRRKKASDK